MMMSMWFIFFCVCVFTSIVINLLCVIVYYFKGMHERVSVQVLYCILISYYYYKVLSSVRCLQHILIFAMQMPF